MKKIKKYIKKHNDLFAITGMMILVFISCFVIAGVITVANYHYNLPTISKKQWENLPVKEA